MTAYLKKLTRLQTALRGLHKDIGREARRHANALARQDKRLAQLNQGFAARQGRTV